MSERETLCGLGSWRPRFLQPLASKKVYIFLYGALGIIMSMQYSYLSATLATLEKLFGITSKETALLMSGNELAQFLFLFAMPLTVKAKKRPLWCGIGLCISAVGLFMMSLPHFITGYNDAVTSSNTIANNSGLSIGGGEATDLCGSEVHLNSLEGNCNEDGSRHVDWVGIFFVFFGIGLTGIGNSVFYSFGIVYLDDNAGKSNSPFMMGLTFTFRLIGPTLGYMLGAKCLTTYVYPSVETDLTELDPRWMGAWWIGFPILATLLFTFSVPLMLFPERLPKEGSDAHKESEELRNLTKQESVKRANFKDAIMRLITNKLYMWNFGSSVFFVFAFMGFGTFMPKYMQFQFRQTGSRSASVAGYIGTGSKAFGLVVSGYLIGKFKFSARTLSGWNVFLGFLYISALVVFSLVGCGTSKLYGDMDASGNYEVDISCNSDCGCPISRPQPVCSKDGVTNFYSPCHAGCTQTINSTATEGRQKMYGDCSCVREATMAYNTSLSREWIEKETLQDLEYPSIDLIDQTHRQFVGREVDEAVSGWCEVEGCDDKFKQFMLTVLILSLVASTGRVGNLLVALRCVEVRDKALSMAFQVVFMSLLAMLPSPIVYGAIIDQSCILWQKECDETTNCLLYNTDTLRNVIMLTTAGIASVGVLCDGVVWYYSKDLKIYEDSNPSSIDYTKEMNGLAIHASTVSLAKDSAFK